MIFRRIFVWLFLLTLIPLSGKANHPPPSPAGGGMLSLDETHDFVATASYWRNHPTRSRSERFRREQCEIPRIY